MNWGVMLIESKALRIIIKGVFLGCIALALFILFMIGNFLFKIYILDYRFDDGELHPPIETSINNDQLNSINGCFSKKGHKNTMSLEIHFQAHFLCAF